MIVKLLAVIVIYPSIGVADNTDEAIKQDEMLLRSSFEEPLRTELLSIGLTPRNAAIAAQHILDGLVECRKSERNISDSSEGRTIIIRLGGNAIATHATPCMDEFLERVDELVR